MNVEKTAKNKPLIPQKFLQSIMFLLWLCHTTTEITYKYLSLLHIYFNIYYKSSLCNENRISLWSHYTEVRRVPLINFQKLFLQIKCFIDYRKLLDMNPRTNQRFGTLKKLSAIRQLVITCLVLIALSDEKTGLVMFTVHSAESPVVILGKIDH